MSQYDFPVLDAERTHDEHRQIISELGHLEPYIAEMDSWVTVPVRLVVDQGIGLHLEVGPYSLNAGDIQLLQKAIDAYRAHRDD